MLKFGAISKVSHLRSTVATEIRVRSKTANFRLQGGLPLLDESGYGAKEERVKEHEVLHCSSRWNI